MKTQDAKVQENAFVRAQQLLAILPGIQYPSKESELLESLGESFLSRIIQAVTYDRNRPYPSSTYSREQLEWIGAVLTAMVEDGNEAIIKKDRIRGLLHLTTLVAPLFLVASPALEAKNNRPVSVIEALEMLSSLHRKLCEYWDCGPDEMRLEFPQRASYALGAFMLSLVDECDSLPFTVADDIHLSYVGIQYAGYTTENVASLLESGELMYHFFADNCGSDLNEDYDLQMEADFPMLSFFVSHDEQLSQKEEINHEDVSTDVGGYPIDRDCAYVVQRIARANGFEDASQTAFFRLAKMFSPDDSLDRLLLTTAAEWTEDECELLMELYGTLNPEQRDTAFGMLYMSGCMPRLHSSYENYLNCVHAVRMAPLVTILAKELEADGNEIDEATYYSAPLVAPDEYTAEDDNLAKGKVIKYFAEFDRINKTHREVSDELMVWMGERAFELAAHAVTLREHGRVDRGLYDSILSTNALGAGAL